MLQSADCMKKYNVICEIKMQKYALNDPNWKELVPGKQYAVAYNKGTANYQLKANFYEARFICKYIFKDAHLVEPMNEREHLAIINQGSIGSIWLGFNDFKTKMHWVKDSNGMEMTYANFRDLRPWRRFYHWASLRC